MHLAGEKWAIPGDHLSVFRLDGIPVLHHRLPRRALPGARALAGSRGVRGSCSTSRASPAFRRRGRWGPTARKSRRARWRTACSCFTPTHPRIAPRRTARTARAASSRPDGNIVCEAGIYDEDTLRATLDLKLATRGNALQSPNSPFLRRWWEEGTALVRRVE